MGYPESEIEKLSNLLVPDPNREIPRLDRILAIRKEYGFRLSYDVLLRPEQFTTASEWIERFKKIGIWEGDDLTAQQFYTRMWIKQSDKKEAAKLRKRKGFERLKERVKGLRVQRSNLPQFGETMEQTKYILWLNNKIDIAQGRIFDYGCAHKLYSQMDTIPIDHNKTRALLQKADDLLATIT